MISRSDTIAAILRLNHSVKPTFLAEFSTNDLNDYLRQLQHLSSEPRASAGTEPSSPKERRAGSRTRTK